MNKENKEKVKSNVCLIKDCGRPTHKESEYCIFHASAEEKTEEEFKQALKEYINKIVEEDSKYDFYRFIFVGQINLKEDLSINTFKKADFGGSTFNGDVDFKEVTFNGIAYFGWATFNGTTFFEGVTFNGDAFFGEATFNGDAFFGEATFNGIAFFEGATFNGDSDFKLKYLGKGLILSKTKVFSGKKLFIKINNDNRKRKIVFERAYLEDAYLDINIITGVLVDFNDALLRNTKIKKGQIENHILQEEVRKFHEAKAVYLLLKNNFHSIAQYEDESWAFKKEKDMERKSNCHFKSLHKWLWSCFLNGLFGYGEQPGKVIISAILIILIFTFIFMSSGISNTSIGGFTSKNFLDCIYFSVVTFTTLGYGDFRPLEGWGRVFSGTEAFIGALMMALFVYTFARRTGGR